MTQESFELQLRTLNNAPNDVGRTPASEEGWEDHEAHATGQTCPRCHQIIKATDEVRRKATGEWVHTSC